MIQYIILIRESSENDAIQAIAAMEKGQVIELTTSIAMTASKLSIKHSLPMADSLILSTAQLYGCTIWTQDSDFKDIPNVKFFPKIANK